MEEIIERLKRCGVPEKTAMCIYMDFVRDHKYEALLAYISAEERENGLERVQQ